MFEEVKTVKSTTLKGIVAAVALAFVAGCFMIALILRPQAFEVQNVALGQAKDGEFIGICQNKILYAVVKVQIRDHEICSIEVLNHKESYMKQAQAIANEVLKQQTLEVDVVSGATLTSCTVLSAIEDALLQAQEE